MSELEPLVVTIEIDTSRVQQAFREAAAAAARFASAFAPFAWRYRLAGQRHRSRLVTRNKQRRHW